MNQTAQEQKFRIFVQSGTLTDRKDKILLGHPVVVLSPIRGEPWNIPTDRMQDILREYYPDLSSTTNGDRCVIFYESNQPRPTK